MDVLRSWAVQDSPPGAATRRCWRAAPSVRGRLAGPRASTRSARVVALYNARTATAVVPADEAAAFGDGAAARTTTRGSRRSSLSAVPEQDEGFAEPVELAVEAISDALDGVTLSRDDLHEAAAAAAARARCCRGVRAARATTRGAGCW